MYYKISRLFLPPAAGKPSTTADVFIANPQIDQESILGKLFLLIEIESTKPAALKTINFFISALPAAYYQSEQISLREKMRDLKVNEIFESALGKVNAEFEDFIKKEKIKLEPKTVNAAAGIVYKNNLIFSTVGKIKTMLIYPEKPDEKEMDKKIYKIADIGGQNTEDKKVHLHKIFSNITDGKIPPEGYFVFSNDILPEYINNRHLAKIITTLPPVSAVENIKNQLHKINSYVTFLALMIKSSATPLIKRSIPGLQVNVTANDSLEQMNETENSTERYLSSAGIMPARRYFGWILSWWAKATKSRPQQLTTVIRDKVFFVKKHRLNFFTKFSYHAKNFFTYAGNLAFYLFKLILHPAELLKKLNRARHQLLWLLKTSAAKTSHFVFNLPLISKILLAMLLVSAFLLFYSLWTTIRGRHEQTREQNYQEIIQSLAQKQNQTEASLLYRNEDRARELIAEITALIGQLSQFKTVDQKVIDKFIATNNAQIEQISHVIKIDNPSELADFKNMAPNAQISFLINTGQRIISSDLNNHSLYAINIANGTVSEAQKNISDADYGVSWNNESALLFANNGGHILNKQDQIEKLDANFSSLGNITSAAVYNSRLYILSSDKNNIFRFTRDFSSADPWIKENINVADAVSFDIDGYVYILKNSGEIIRLLSGYANELKLSDINPAFSNPAKIRLTGDGEKGYIYILEPSQQRLVVFDKTGKFLLQYKAPSLTNLKDFIVLDKEKKILLLNDATVYEINIEQ